MGLGVVSSAARDVGGGGDSGFAGGGLTVTTWPDQPPPGDSLQLTLTNSSGLPNPIQYNVVPLIGSKGLNGSDTVNETVHISGIMVAANQSNFEQLTTSDTVAYLSCDVKHGGSGGGGGGGDTFINASRMLNTLIGNSIKAIVLYSEAKNGCLLGNADALQYRNVLSMIDAGDAQQVLGYLNGTDPAERVAIVGNASTLDPGSPASPTGGTRNSAVAMSILYSITGVITLLFLAIIATGAVRAHRYPERYGPRSGVAGQPRQSRAKGLARAVLETIPIVKFSSPQPAKPDPELELDAATVDGRDPAVAQREAADPAEQLNPEVTPAIPGDRGNHNHNNNNNNNDNDNDGNNDGISDSNSKRNSKRISSAATAAGSQHERDESAAVGVNLGCSICTEDFKVGEDMRVLPCNHQFHPACIDPWLINVSGTCPLCRLDLSAEAGGAGGAPAEDRSSTLPPPLRLEGIDGQPGPTTHRHRLSRLFDINRLRQASAEEQIAALREMRRSETGPEGPDAEGVAARADGDGAVEEGSQRARLATRLKDKFRIRTRARSPDRPRES